MSDDRPVQQKFDFDAPIKRKPKKPEYAPPQPSLRRLAATVLRRVARWLGAGVRWGFRNFKNIHAAFKIGGLFIALVLLGLGVTYFQIDFGDYRLRIEQRKPAPPNKGWEPKIEKAK